jgi:hypothetical protein
MKKYKKNYTLDKATINTLEGFINQSEVLRLLVASLNPLANREGIKEQLIKLKK